MKTLTTAALLQASVADLVAFAQAAGATQATVNEVAAAAAARDKAKEAKKPRDWKKIGIKMAEYDLEKLIRPLLPARQVLTLT